MRVDPRLPLRSRLGAVLALRGGLRDPSLLAAVALLALAGAMALVASARGIPVAVLLRDPPVQYGFPAYAGVLSFAGVGLLGAAASCTWFAAFVGAARRGVLLAAGALSAILMADDLFVLHERASDPGQAAIFAVYAVLAAALVLTLLRDGTPPPLGGLTAAAGFLLLSVLADLSSFKALGDWPEDFAKLAGFGAWSAFWIALAAEGVRSRRQPPEGAPPAGRAR